jgi:hypothetical protein
VTSAPARANKPPKYPPTAPAPTTAIVGHFSTWLIARSSKKVFVLHQEDAALQN